ncbi:MAG: hypothetical protein IPG50_11825 [Myxococcales bacterium]|nr:hypothetical protein [Myxococcales bacterium]
MSGADAKLNSIMKNELTHVSRARRSTVPLEQAHVGIDIGRVIMAASDEGRRADTSFLSASDEETC